MATIILLIGFSGEDVSRASLCAQLDPAGLGYLTPYWTDSCKIGVTDSVPGKRQANLVDVLYG